MKITKSTAWIIGIGVAVITLTAAKKSADHDKFFEISKNIEIFTNMYKELNTYYVDDLDPSRMMRTGIDAIMGSLDPYTNYISESDMEGYRLIVEGKYNGIGASFDKIGEFVTVMDLYENSPAQKAGLKAGDRIAAVDGKNAQNRSVDEVGDILSGAPGTDVVLTVRRPGTTKDMKITITRDEITEENVPYEGMLRDGVGYVALTTFTRDAGGNVAKALKDMKAKNPDMKGLVLDLRGNGGGLLTEAVNLVNIFIPKGEVVVAIRGKVVEWDKAFKSLNEPVDEKIPVVILIDKGSASASEIVSGALQDLDRAVLMGQRSYGKGLVQNTRDVGYNAKIKLTTAKYYIPSGRCIQAVRYEKGKPVELPDSLQAKFTTKNGRTVLDGGGIKPDVYLETNANAGLLVDMQEQHIIFEYVNEYCIKHPKVDSTDKFKFTEFDDFTRFLAARKYEYISKAEKSLQEARTNAEKDKYSPELAAEIKTLETKLHASRAAELQKYQADIISLIEQEVMSRFYYQRGRSQIRLRNDTEIERAIDLLLDPAKYNRLLKSK